VGAKSSVSNVGGWLGGKELTFVKDGIEERDLREKVAEGILNLDLTSVELVTNLSENVEVFTLSDLV
jgi:hypothetical protein